MKKIVFMTIIIMIVLYFGVSAFISCYVFDIVNSNFGKMEHNYGNENEYPYYLSDSTVSRLKSFWPSLNDYLAEVLDHSSRRAPVGEGKTYYSFKMSFPFTMHLFTRATAKYYYSYELFEIENDGTEKRIQACKDVCITVYLEFKAGKWIIVFAE